MLSKTPLLLLVFPVTITGLVLRTQVITLGNRISIMAIRTTTIRIIPIKLGVLSGFG